MVRSWRRTRSHPDAGFDPEEVGRLLLAGHAPPRVASVVNRLHVAVADIDLSSGIAAVWLARQVRSRVTVQDLQCYEMSSGTWQYLGRCGSIRSAARQKRVSAAALGPAHLLQVEGSCASRDLAWRAGRPLSERDAWSLEDCWIGCTTLRVATEVARVQVSGRQGQGDAAGHAVAGAVDVHGLGRAAHGHVVVAWKARSAVPHLRRPRITALDGTGNVLTELGPGNYLDTATMAAIT